MDQRPERISGGSPALVVAILVAEDRPDSWVRAAIGAFQEQSYPNRRLVVPYAGEPRRFEDPRIVEVPGKTTANFSLREQLESLDLDGHLPPFRYLTFWHPTQLSHPHRLAFQMAMRPDQGFMLLGNQLRYYLEENHLAVDPLPNPRSVLFARSALYSWKKVPWPVSWEKVLERATSSPEHVIYEPTLQEFPGASLTITLQPPDIPANLDPSLRGKWTGTENLLYAARDQLSRFSGRAFQFHK